MRVIFTHDVADDAARLAIGATGDIAGFLTGVEDAAVDRLQAVADIGQRAADDHRHGIIEIAGLISSTMEMGAIKLSGRSSMGGVVAKLVSCSLGGQKTRGMG